MADQLKADLTLTRNAHSMEVARFKDEISDLREKLETTQNELTTSSISLSQQKLQLEELTQDLEKEQNSCQAAINEVSSCMKCSELRQGTLKPWPGIDSYASDIGSLRFKVANKFT